MKKTLSLNILVQGKRKLQRFKQSQVDEILKLSDKLKLRESEAARLIKLVGDETLREVSAVDRGLFAAAVDLFYEERVAVLRAIATLLKVRCCWSLLC